MGSQDRLAIFDRVADGSPVSGRDIKRLRAAAYADGAVSRDIAERLLTIACGAPRGNPALLALAIEAVSDHIVHQETPSGYISQANADWLVGAISVDGVVASMAGLEILVCVLEKAKSSPASLSAFALRQVANAVTAATGPLAGVPGRMPDVVDRWDVELIRRVLYAFGGSGNVAITREEAEILFEINDRTVEEMNDPSWNDLFVKAMANFLMGASGYEAPTRQEALRRDTLFDRADVDVGAFFARMVSGGLSAIFDAYAQPADQDGDWEASTRAKAAAQRRAEHVDDTEAAWLAEKLASGRMLRDNERALLGLIKTSAPSIAPALEPLIARVA